MQYPQARLDIDTEVPAAATDDVALTEQPGDPAGLFATALSMGLQQHVGETRMQRQLGHGTTAGGGPVGAVEGIQLAQ